jgi:hypothetical protein
VIYGSKEACDKISFERGFVDHFVPYWIFEPGQIGWPITAWLQKEGSDSGFDPGCNRGVRGQGKSPGEWIDTFNALDCELDVPQCGTTIS